MRSITAMLLVLLQVTSGGAQAPSIASRPETTSPPAAVETAHAPYDELLRTYAAAGQFSGAALVTRNGKTLFRGAYGEANREWNIRATPETRFRIASMTKQFTAAAILQLAEAGRLSLDDKLGQHYASAPPAWTDVTIRQLLTHSAGVPNWNNPERLLALRGRSPEAAVALVRDKPLDFPAGTGFAYSNTGYILLGMIIERVAKQSYTAYLRDHIFTPLGMADTGYDVNSDILSRRASGYHFDDRGVQNASFVPMTLFFAGGGLYSTVDDLQRWEEGLRAGRVINAASLASMFADHGHGYGYGQYVGRLNNRRAVWHGGGIPGFATNLVHYPDNGVTVIALSNMQNTHVEKLTNELAGIAFAEWKPPPEIALAPGDLEPLVGAYLYNPTLVLRVRLANGRLTARFTENGEFEISPSAPLSFFARAVDAKFEFDPSVDGKSPRVAHTQRVNRKVCERIPDAQADEIEKLVYARRDAAEGRQGRSS